MPNKADKFDKGSRYKIECLEHFTFQFSSRTLKKFGFSFRKQTARIQDEVFGRINSVSFCAPGEEICVKLMVDSFVKNVNVAWIVSR